MTWKLEDGGPWTYLDRSVTGASGETFVLRYGPTSPRGEATWVVQVVGPDGTEATRSVTGPGPERSAARISPRWLLEHVQDAAAADDALGRFAHTHPWLIHTGT